VVRFILPVLVALLAAVPGAEQRPAAEPPAITGEVLAPDGTAVTAGNVALMTYSTMRATAAIDKTGRFRLQSDSQGWQRLFISVPGYAPYRADLSVPSSRTMALPAITLAEPAYLRARFVTVDGEPLGAMGVTRRTIDGYGSTIADPLDHVQQQVAEDGTITIGPLPRGRALIAFDRAPFAPTRLPDVNVTGSQKLIDRGVITIQPAARLQVDVLDGEQRLVPRHEVWIEDAVQPSPLSFQPVRTDAQGRATFDRLGMGRYRVWTRSIERCNNAELTIARIVSASTSGTAAARLVIGGRATIRVTTPLGALYSRAVRMSPDAPGASPWQTRFMNSSLGGRRPMTIPSFTPSCGGTTDGEGRVTLTPFPPGPAQVRVQLFNSTYVVRVNVPENPREIAITVPDGLLPVHVTNRSNGEPVRGAQLVWSTGGVRVEASTTPNGDALLEGVGTAGGTLTITDRDYQTLEGAFDETPGTLQEVALLPLSPARVPVRVIDSDGAPVADAIVELLAGAGDTPEFVATDAKGVAAFTEVAAGTLRFTAHAKGFASATVQVPEEGRASIVITLKPL
jgi:hypothetical protein